jgi:quercetin dioxygenase-like cupin family protein
LVTRVVTFARGGGRELVPGVRMQPLFGDAAMLNLLELEPDALVPLHDHPHEQLGLVLEGELVLTVAGEEHVLRPDDAYQIPGGVEHSALAGPAGARVLDVFQPVREDYRES